MSRFLKAVHCVNSKTPPIWLMRQAGRYMPQYQQLKQKHSLLTLFKTPELITQVTLLPEELLGIDASILFSDILMVLELFQKKWSFKENVGPLIENPLSTSSDVETLPIYSAKEILCYVQTAIFTLKKILKTPLIGFAGAPFTIASYLIEGKTSRDLRKTKQWFYQDPQTFHALLHKITEATIDYLTLQIESGVDALQLFDSWTHVLSLADFKELSLTYAKKIINHFKPTGIPLLFFCKGSSFFAEEIAAISPHCISLDWQCDLGTIRRRIPDSIAVQGNLDPHLLLGPTPLVKKEASRLLTSMKGDKGYIFNLGHGIVPETPFDTVKCLVDHIQEHR